MIRPRAVWLAVPVVVIGTVGGCGGGGGSAGAPAPTGLPARTPQASVSASAPARQSLGASTPGRTAPSAVVSVTTTTVTLAPSAAQTAPATAATATDNDSTAWGWIIAGLVLVLVLAVGIPFVARHKREERWHDWQQHAKGAVVAGRTTEQLMPVSPARIDDLVQWQNLGHQVEQAARTLDAVADASPRANGNAAAHHAAQGLRDLSFALESGRTAQGDATPMADLVAIEVAVHDRRDELDAAFAELDDLLAGPVPQH